MVSSLFVSFVFLTKESITHCLSGFMIASNNAIQAEMQPTTVANRLNENGDVLLEEEEEEDEE